MLVTYASAGLWRSPPALPRRVCAVCRNISDASPSVRFDLKEDGARIGFEDVAALMGKQVRDVMENRKYHGSYEGVAEALRLVNVPKKDLAEHFSQVAFSVMVGNGDAHEKLRRAL
jgi:hypothetical protein